MTPNTLLDTNAEGLALIKRWESFRSGWYLCPANVWTIGYGFTEPMAKRYLGLRDPLIEMPTVSDVQADKLLTGVLMAVYERSVESTLVREVSSNAFSALVSFCYNVGGTNMRKSTLMRLVNEGRMDAAAKQFGRWIYAKGVIYNGLISRRKEEMDLFLKEGEPLALQDLITLTPLPPEEIPHSKVGVTKLRRR